MSTVPHCLDNIIGLSRTACDCFDPKSFQSDVSTSGRYLDETEGLSLNVVDMAADCEQGNVWDMLDKARSNAILSFKTDMMAKLLMEYKHKRKPWSGLMGGTDFKNTLDINGDYAGIQIYTQNIIGGIMSVKRIGLVFDSTVDFTIYVYDNLSDDVVDQFDVHANVNRLTWYDLASPLNLDMNNYGNESPRYWLLYAKQAFKPKDVKGSCGCGGGHYAYYFNANAPTFRAFPPYEKYRWSEFVMLTGTSGSTLSDRENWGNTQYLQGLVLDVDFKCKIQDLLCKETIDFDTNENAATMAAAIQYRAAASLIDSILASGNINRYTMTDRERLMGKKNTYITEYNKRLDFITQNINLGANDCLECNDFNDLLKVGIFA